MRVDVSAWLQPAIEPLVMNHQQMLAGCIEDKCAGGEMTLKISALDPGISGVLLQKNLHWLQVFVLCWILQKVHREICFDKVPIHSRTYARDAVEWVKFICCDSQGKIALD